MDKKDRQVIKGRQALNKVERANKTKKVLMGLTQPIGLGKVKKTDKVDS